MVELQQIIKKKQSSIMLSGFTIEQLNSIASDATRLARTKTHLNNLYQLLYNVRRDDNLSDDIKEVGEKEATTLASALHYLELCINYLNDITNE